MMNYQPDVVVQAFIRFNPDKSFELQDLVDFDARLFAANDQFILGALQAQGITNPSDFDKSRVLQFAVVATGDGFSSAIIFGAAAYRRAIDVGAIG
jgi:hypothetical protein